VGVLAAFGYSHYLGEGKQLAETQAELSAAKDNLAKLTQEGQKAKSETDAMSTQIQQLTATKADLQHQLDTAKAAPASRSILPTEGTPRRSRAWLGSIRSSKRLKVCK